ncbi:MAG: hypothetical protein AAF502_17015 [Bacteroidota bacterium]
MKQITRHHALLGTASLAMIVWFLPMALIAFYFAILSNHQYVSGNPIASRRCIVKMRKCLRVGTFAGLLVLLVACGYVFTKGGDLVPAIASFY